MSDDSKKKPSKQTFFRINSQGELSRTEKSAPHSEELEPKSFTESKNSPFDNSPTEVKPKEPTIAESQIENTHTGVFQEPKTFTALSTNEPEKKLNVEPSLSLEDGQKEVHEPSSILASESEEVNKESSIEELFDLANKEEIPIEPLDSNLENNISSTFAPSNHDNLATLKNYIVLKEKEVEDLKEQQKQYQNVLLKLKRTHSELNQTNMDLQHELEAAKTNEQLIKTDQVHLREKHENEIAILKNDFEQQQQQNGFFQEQLQDLNRQKNIWKEKISDDLKKIKIKEKELENRYELLKKDTETLLDSKDQQILELKKKSDAFELELESLEERLRSEYAILNSINSKKRRLIETLKLAISLLEQLDSSTESAEERKIG